MILPTKHLMSFICLKGPRSGRRRLSPRPDNVIRRAPSGRRRRRRATGHCLRRFPLMRGMPISERQLIPDAIERRGQFVTFGSVLCSLDICKKWHRPFYSGLMHTEMFWIGLSSLDFDNSTLVFAESKSNDSPFDKDDFLWMVNGVDFTAAG